MKLSISVPDDVAAYLREYLRRRTAQQAAQQAADDRILTESSNDLSLLDAEW